MTLERARELRRIQTEGYGILTESDIEELYDEEDFQRIEEYPIRHVRAISIFGGSVRDQRGDPFPEKWDHWCQHCCHPFETAPFGIPVKYDEYRSRFFCIGRFCSDSCAKAVIAEHKWSLGPIGESFSVMIRKAYGRGWDYKPGTAPPRTRLKQFGGDLSIEEFRAYGNRFICYHVPSNVLIEMEQLAEVERQHQDHQREHRKQTIQRAHDVAVTPRKPRPPVRRRRPERVKMTRATPLPKKTYTLDAFWR